MHTSQKLEAIGMCVSGWRQTDGGPSLTGMLHNHQKGCSTRVCEDMDDL